MEKVGIMYGNLIYFKIVWYILGQSGIFHGYWGNLIAIWYIFPVWYIVPRKIWQPLYQGIGLSEALAVLVLCR
jgi:hypothetical protein